MQFFLIVILTDNQFFFIFQNKTKIKEVFFYVF